MIDLHWTPRQLGSLTIPQLMCLLNEAPPGPRLSTFEEYEAFMAKRKEEEAQWVRS